MRVTLPEEVRMRGDDRQQAAMWSHISPEQRVPPDHPLRPIRAMIDGVLRELSPRFEALYAKRGRPSIAPEKLLRALVLQLLYSVQRTAVDGATGLQPAVPLVRGVEHGRSHLGCDGVHQEPAAAAGRRHRPGVLRAGAGPGPRAAAAGR